MFSNLLEKREVTQTLSSQKALSIFGVNGTRYKITVNDDGSLQTTAV